MKVVSWHKELSTVPSISKKILPCPFFQFLSRFLECEEMKLTDCETCAELINFRQLNFYFYEFFFDLLFRVQHSFPLFNIHRYGYIFVCSTFSHIFAILYCSSLVYYIPVVLFICPCIQNNKDFIK